MLLPSILWNSLIDGMSDLNQSFNIDLNMSLISFSLWYLNICVFFVKTIGIGIVDLKWNLAQISNLVNFEHLIH
jgi:hypothetical protein